MKSLFLVLILSILPVFAGKSTYGGFLGGVYSCFSSFEKSRGVYDKTKVDGIISGKITTKKGCSDSHILKTTANLIKKSHDCAKTAVMLRNEYLRGKGRRGRKLHGVSTKAIAEGFNGVSGVLKYHKIDLSRDDDPNLMSMQAGDIMHFDNVNCPQFKNRFHGHTMTVMSVTHRNGKPYKIKVLEGHTRKVNPTFREIKVSALLGNGRYKPRKSRAGKLYQVFFERNPIPDLSCTAFRGMATWRGEPRVNGGGRKGKKKTKRGKM